MPSVQSVGGRSLVIPALVVDITADDVALANWTELNESFLAAGENNGTIVLPAGTIYAGTATGSDGKHLFSCDERMAGMTVQGAGRGKTLLADPRSSSAPFHFESRAMTNRKNGTINPGSNQVTAIADISQYLPGDLLYFWVFQSGARTPRLQRMVTAVNGGNNSITLDGTMNLTGADQFEHAKQAAKLIGTLSAGEASLSLFDKDDHVRFQVGDDVFISDGPGYDEVYGEFVRVASVDAANAKVVVFPPLRRSYMTDLACLVPGPHMTDITLRDLSIRASQGGPHFLGSFRLARRSTFENLQLVSLFPGSAAAREIYLTSNTGMTIDNCDIGCVLALGSTIDAVVSNVSMEGFVTEEYCLDCDVVNSQTTGPLGFRETTPPSARINLTNVDIIGSGYVSQPNNFHNSGVVFAPESRFTNVRIMEPLFTDAIVYLNNNDLTLTNVGSQMSIEIGGQRILISGQYMIPTSVGTPSFTLRAGTTGVFLTPLLPSTAQLIDGSTVGSWLHPVLADKSGFANLPGGLTVNNLTGGYPVRLQQSYLANEISVLTFQPLSSPENGGKIYVDVTPANGKTLAGLRLLNADSTQTASFLVFEVDGANAKIRSVQGSAPGITNLTVSELPVKFAGSLVVASNSATPGTDLAVGQCGIWYDSTNFKIMFKAKVSTGPDVFKTGQVPLI